MNAPAPAPITRHRYAVLFYALLATIAVGPLLEALDFGRVAMEALLTAVRPRTLSVCRGVLPYTPDAEDACQEALIKVAEKIGTWIAPMCAQAWEATATSCDIGRKIATRSPFSTPRRTSISASRVT